jgi:hypothetical protein
MKKLRIGVPAAGLALALALAALPAWAQGARDATLSDVQDLRDELDRLDDSLSELESSHPRSRELRERADRVREDVVWLREEIERNRSRSADSVGVPYPEVERIHAAIVALRTDVDAAVDTTRAARGGDVRVPEGTEIQVRLEDRLSSETAQREDRFEATVARSVRIGDRMAIPAGTTVRGTVREVESAERLARSGRLELGFDSLVLDDGTRVDLRSRVVRLSESMDKGETGKRAGLGALLGGILGGVIEGKEGAIIGVLVGGTGAVVASRGEEVELPAGTMLTLELERPVVVASR